MAATGLQKGGIYRHFESKQALALAAFEHAVGKMTERFAEALGRARTPLGKIRAIIAVYARIPSDPPVSGGCPILNASVEADDGDPELRAAAKRVMDELRATIRRLVRAAVRDSELGPGINAERFANVLVAQLEGAVMLSKLYGDDAPMRHTCAHLEQWLASLAPPAKGR
jgi:AcrR family transcriptional regulator